MGPCFGCPQSWVAQWYLLGPNSEQLAPQNFQANTHVGSLGALGSFQPLITWVALKCKSKRLAGVPSGAVREQGRSDAPVPLAGRTAHRGWECRRPPPWAGRDGDTEPFSYAIPLYWLILF